MADIPVERSEPSYSRPSVRLPNGVGNDSWNGGRSFFDRLFGNPIRPEPPRRSAAPRRAADDPHARSVRSTPLITCLLTIPEGLGGTRLFFATLRR